jgi:thioredoxin 1
VAHYWYKHCAMCKLMSPVIKRVVREYESQIYYVDVEISYNKKTMSHAGVRSIPAVQVFKDGKVSLAPRITSPITAEPRMCSPRCICA